MYYLIQSNIINLYFNVSKIFMLFQLYKNAHLYTGFLSGLSNCRTTERSYLMLRVRYLFGYKILYCNNSLF